MKTFLIILALSMLAGRAAGDRLVEGGGFSGVGDNPDLHPGRFSSEARFQERITDALYRGAIAPRENHSKE